MFLVIWTTHVLVDKVFVTSFETSESVEADRPDAVGHDKYERLMRDATINDILPLLVYMFEEELVGSPRDEVARRPESGCTELTFRLRSSRSRAGRPLSSRTGRAATKITDGIVCCRRRRPRS
jgi:hypothetical protein